MAKEFSLGLVEVSGLGHAIIMLDDMLKAGDVEFVATERKLGGRLVTIVITGDISSVQAAVDAGVARAKACGDKIYKASQVIARPHPEIFPFLHLNEEEGEPVNTESAETHVGSVGKKTASRAAKTARTTKSTTKTAKTTTRKRTTKKSQKSDK